MVQVTENRDLKDQFVARLQDRCAPARTDIHVSDLTWCLRKAYYRRYQNKKLSDNQLLFFLDGHQRHEGIQSLLGSGCAEHEVSRYGVVGHLDLLGEHPIEIKTTRSQPKNRIQDNVLRQLAYYCLLTNSMTCSLITQYIETQLITFEQISFSKLDLDAYLRDMIEDRDLLQFAYDRKNPDQLPFVENWKCQKCEFCELCERAASNNLKESKNPSQVEGGLRSQ